MTSQEARKQLDECENQITGTYSNLRAAARSMGSSAAEAASKKTAIRTLLPLIVSLLGLVLYIEYHQLWKAVFLIILGIVIAVKSHKSAASVQKDVERQVGYLNDTLDRNSKI